MSEKHLLNRVVGIASVCRLYPDKIEQLITGLDLDCRGMEMVSAEWARGNVEAACRAVLLYYKQKTDLIFQPQGDGTEQAPEAAALMEDTFTIYGDTAKVPRNADGFLDWQTKGGSGDYNWGLILNRHEFFNKLYDAYIRTGNRQYAAAYDRFVRDWVMANPWVTRRAYEDLEWNGRPWRSLEAAIRVPIWARGFYGFQAVEDFTEAGRLLQLISIREHAEHIVHYSAWPRHEYPNIYATEMMGLALIAYYWPEFKQAGNWLSIALSTFTEIVEQQVYPDGAHKELTSSYHLVAAKEFDKMSRLAEEVGRPFPERFRRQIESMWHYLACTVKPDGSNPLNADSDTKSIVSLLMEKAEQYNRLDWMYMATQGELGEKPDGEPSMMFPWAGQLIMRNGWDRGKEASHWAFFDIGPFGISGHGHRDKLHLSIYANGRDLLVDSGRYIYNNDKWLIDYFRESSAGHNVILLNGHSQCEGEKIAHEPVSQYAITPKADFAKGTFTGGFYAPGSDTRVPTNPSVHSRAVLYVKHQCWIVVDRIQSDVPQVVEPLWHFHPDCTLKVEGQQTLTTDEGCGNLLIVPVSDLNWQTKIVKGQEYPTVQGWYSESYGRKVPSPCSVYSAFITGNGLFAWVIIPGIGSIPSPTIRLLELTEHRIRFALESPGIELREVAVQMGEVETMSLSNNETYKADCVLLDREGQVIEISLPSAGSTEGR